MEKELKKLYRQAQKEISEKWNKYMERAEQRLVPLQNEYERAVLFGTSDEIKKAKEALERKKKSILYQNKLYKDMLNETTDRLVHVNELAVQYVNNQMPHIYALNHNDTLISVHSDISEIRNMGVSFQLIDDRTVRNLIKAKEIQLPRKTVDIPKDKRWNAKAVNSQVLQGILQGESIPKISKRLQTVTNMNMDAAIRNARTMCTSAENSGRLSGMKEAEERGIVYEKQWMSTHDGRTRESHQRLDGETVPLDEPFGNDLMFPGDMNGDPEEVYNCRCSMVRHLIGFRRADGSISKVGDIERYNPTYFDSGEE